MQKCPKCGRSVIGTELWKSSETKMALSDGLNFVSKWGVKIANGLDLIPGGRIGGAIIRGLTEDLYDPRDDRYFKFECQCGNTWESKTRN